jgi:sugar phosphate isomerase/epimerase
MYSRREFGKLAIASVPLCSAISSAYPKINSKVQGVQLGTQTYSFRDRPLDAAIKAMVEVGLGDCELFSPHIEPGGPGGGGRGNPEARAALRKWRLSVSMDEFKAIRKKFDDAGINIHAFNLSFRDDFTDEEIDRGFEMAKALGVKVITASSTVTAAKRVAPFADKHKIIVAMHGHSDLKDPNQFAKPESFAQAMAMSKYFAVNLDIGHFTAAGYDPVDYIKNQHEHIMVLHLKDRKKDEGPNTPWGQGDTPIKAVLQLLKEKKYPIPAFIEYEYKGNDDAVVEVKRCFQYCKDALA